jgi:CRISPR type I-D-associated protein Csc3/Cas10d
MEPLRQMAVLAAEEHLKGRSFKRNSILKPLDIILENLEREPQEEMRDLVRRASERDIFDHIDRITEAKYRLGLEKREKKQDQIRIYVDLFFDGILAKMHEGDVNRLLQRNKLIRSAYLTYYRDALPERTKDQADKEQSEEALQQEKDTEE